MTMAFTKTQLMKQIHAAATLGILTPADLASVFNDAPKTRRKTSPATATRKQETQPRAKYARTGARGVPEKLRVAARNITDAHELLPTRRFLVVHTKNDDTPHRLVLVDADTNRQVGHRIGEIVTTPAQVKVAAKRILKRAAKVDAN